MRTRVLTGGGWRSLAGRCNEARTGAHAMRWHRRLSSTLQHEGPSSSSLPLAGIRVLDMTRVLAGPYCTQILGDLGAEIIKVEHPTRGDDTRAWGPPFAPYTAASGKTGPGESAYFLAVNRNKKSLALSFQDPRGVAALHRLAAQCDVVVENYLPGSLAKYGLDYASIRAINPGIVYASITGYGQTGPYSARAGYDVMVEAEMGLMHITGERDRPGVKVGVAITDLTTGLYASNSILGALLGRALKSKRQGSGGAAEDGAVEAGQYLDIALSDVQVASLANIASSALISGEPDSGRWGTAHPSIVPYRSFPTTDGAILLGGGNDRLFGIIARHLGHSEWATDPRFTTNALRVANRTELEQLISDVTATRTTAEWQDALEGSGAPYAAVNDIQGTLNHPHVRARGMVQAIEHPACGPIEVVDHPVKWLGVETGTRASRARPPPVLGEHTSQVLREVAGLGEKEVATLLREGVVVDGAS